MKYLLLFIPYLLIAQNAYEGFSKYDSYVPSGYNPVDGNTILMLRADQGVTLINDSVDVWADQSGGGHDFSAAAQTNRPKYNSTYPRLEFDATDDQLSNPAPATWWDVDQDEVRSIEIHIELGNTGVLYRPVGKYLNSSNWNMVYWINDQGLYYGRDAGVNVWHITQDTNYIKDGVTHTASFVLFSRGTGGSEDPAVNSAAYIDGVRVDDRSGFNLDTVDVSFSGAVKIPVQTWSTTMYIYAIRYSDNARTETEVLQFHNWCVATFGE